MTARVLLAAAILLVALAPGVHAAQALEFDILDAYLAEHDVAPALAHCARHSGHVNVPGGGPRPLPTGGTNAILVEHKEFHAEHGDGPGHVPSTDPQDRYGEIFLGWHEAFIGAYQDWREAAGHPPLEAWDPGTPMPSSLAYEFPGRGCVPGRDDDPKAGFPTWATFEGGDTPDPLFGHTHLCAFVDRNEFGKSMSMDWHVMFHGRIGGDSRVGEGPRDPAFWAAHLFLIQRTQEFEERCPALVAAAAEPQVDDLPRAIPGPGMLVVPALALTACAWARKLRLPRK